MSPSNITEKNSIFQSDVSSSVSNAQKQDIDADLTHVIEMWQKLPEHIRAAIMALMKVTQIPNQTGK